MENSIKIRVKPAYVFIIITFALISSLIIFSSKIPIYIRFILISVFFIFLIFNGFRNIFIRKEFIEIVYPFNVARKKIYASNIKKIKFTKGPRASFPFSFRVYYKNGTKIKNFGFSTENIKVITDVLVVFLKWKIPIELGTDNLANAYYNDAKDIINKDK